MNKKEILKRTTFGERIAEDEIENLRNYFVTTEDWRLLFENEIDIIYGTKGAGKSALFSILDSKNEELFDRNILLTTAENPRGNTVFEGLTSSPPTSEVEFVRLWKLYFLIITVSEIEDWGLSNKKLDEIKGILQESNLIPFRKGLKSILKLCRDYVKHFINVESLQPGVDLNDATLIPSGVNFKVTFREPSINEESSGIRSIEYLFELLETALIEENYSLWIAIDRLDVAFSENVELETNALRALFKVYRDLTPYSHIKIKIFLRDDIWRRITEEGFREASHITKTITINWSKEAIVNLIIRRLVSNEMIVNEYRINIDEVLNEYSSQESLFYRLFPEQIDVGEKKPKTIDWILSRVRDGKGIVAPREIIHLLNESKQYQIKLLEIGSNDLENEWLVGRSAFKNALDKVSKVRLEQTIYAEYPSYRDCIQKLEEEKTEQNPESLSKIWNVDLKQAMEIAKSLVEIGIFEQKGNKLNPRYWVPFLYRPALRMIQGSAD